MKKKYIIIAIIITLLLIVGAGCLLLTSTNEMAGEDMEETPTIKYGNQTFYEPDYSDGNSPDKLAHLSYSIPPDFTPIGSSDDSVSENCFINTKTGVQISITEQHKKSNDEYTKLSEEYLEGTSDVEKFQVGNYTCYKYDYQDEGNIIECDFHMIAGDSFYAGLMFHPTEVDNEIADEPEPIALTPEEIEQFNALCKSLRLN